MDMVQNIANSMEAWFKSAPKIPENGRETLAKIFPWLALIFGVLQLWAAYGLWVIYDRSDALLNYINTFYDTGYSTTDKAFIFLGIAVLVVDAVILLVAWPKLQKRERSGWDLIFLSALLNIVYSVISLFIDGRGVATFILSLFFSAVGFWLLFQVRPKFNGHVPAPARVKSSAPEVHKDDKSV